MRKLIIVDNKMKQWMRCFYWNKTTMTKISEIIIVRKHLTNFIKNHCPEQSKIIIL